MKTSQNGRLFYLFVSRKVKLPNIPLFGKGGKKTIYSTLIVLGDLEVYPDPAGWLVYFPLH